MSTNVLTTVQLAIIRIPRRTNVRKIEQRLIEVTDVCQISDFFLVGGIAINCNDNAVCDTSNHSKHKKKKVLE